MFMYGGFWRALKKATTFKKRHGDTGPKLGQDPPAYKTLRAGGRRGRRRRKPAWVRTVRLCWGGAVVFILAGYPLMLVHADRGLILDWGPYVFFIVIPLFLSLSFAVAAFQAKDQLSVRAIATLVNLSFPILVACEVVAYLAR